MQHILVKTASSHVTFDYPRVAYRGSRLVCQCKVHGVLNWMSGRLSGKSRGSLCSLPRKWTRVTPSGVKVNLVGKIIFFILLLISAQLIHLYCVYSLQQVDGWHTWILKLVICSGASVCSMFCRKSAGSWHREHHAFAPQNALTA